ncbi:MAG: hypothetical protein KGJ38_08320 [Burkholderiaceae bacterium]|nr:hypothetical protein [Burkholderiaceae bacterium]
MHAYRTEHFEHSGRRFVAEYYVDEDMGPPWKVHDGHGPVSDWTRRDKRPGERVLCEDRGARRYYDWQAACKLARKDGWNVEPFDAPNRIERAVQADFDRLRAWCNDEWHWCGVSVRLDGADENFYHALWGIESDAGGYFEEVREELADECLADEDRARHPVRDVGV